MNVFNVLNSVTLQGNEKKIYDFIVRHFLACCSEDAQGFETTVEIDINQERVNIIGHLSLLLCS